MENSRYCSQRLPRVVVGGIVMVVKAATQKQAQLLCALCDVCRVPTHSRLGVELKWWCDGEKCSHRIAATRSDIRAVTETVDHEGLRPRGRGPFFP